MSTSALRFTPTLLGAHNPPKSLSEPSEPLSERMRSLVPIVAAIAVAALWIPHFVTGFWVGPRILLTLYRHLSRYARFGTRQKKI